MVLQHLRQSEPLGVPNTLGGSLRLQLEGDAAAMQEVSRFRSQSLSLTCEYSRPIKAVCVNVVLSL